MLPAAFLDRPVAHRGYHDIAQERPENSRAAFEAAITAGYGIELDLQLSGDDVAMVFHDYALERLTGEPGPIRQKSAADLASIPLLHGNEAVPTLAEVLDLVDGRTPLLIEFKDQDGAMGPAVGTLEAAAAQVLRGYDGPMAVMSFNPHSVAALADLLPDVPRGLTTAGYTAEDWPTLPAAVRDHLRHIPDFDRTRSSFVSHDVKDLQNPALAELKSRGVPLLCWTIRSPEQEANARQIVDNVTFEGYAA
ncbi:glycerophosphodiester phosphodiesterase family protein [Thalassococcus lentus]|uniref:Glycerophosphodiester phosphodiesterase family protein n=1 Tax=Thalassococcus lentus TaxID=1210524 RepID=A0ABT4XT19_9RHOB|nr:glycerophosphodiester phosphodiesterase family protein [Thalassococcus lentus]MDA7425080.1 glycerophosphodiester phosphodiesterase family protein [Thalassococcus lentus]